MANCTQVHDMWPFGPLVYHLINISNLGWFAQKLSPLSFEPRRETSKETFLAHLSWKDFDEIW